MVEAGVFDQRALGVAGVECRDGLSDPGAVGGVDGDAGGFPGLAFLFGDVPVDGAHLFRDLLDPAPGVFQLPVEPCFDGAEFSEALGRRQVGHAFDSRGGADRWHPGGVNQERYHLTLTADSRPIMHGWWGSEQVARGMLPAWVGSWGELPGARVVLVDEDEQRVLAAWPES